VRTESKEQISVYPVKQISNEQPVLNYPLIQFLSCEGVQNDLLTIKLFNCFGRYLLYYEHWLFL